MHYANGREAKVGDLVRGKGYNIKHEIIGLLVHAAPNLAVCNCSVSCVAVGSYGITMHRQAHRDIKGNMFEGQLSAIPTTEYGQLDAFVALDPLTGEVLPPEIK